MPRECEQITDTNFKDRINQNEVAAMVVFAADWCGTGHILEPMLERVTKRYSGSMQSCVLDVEKYPIVMADFNVYKLPTFLLFEKGELVDQFVGLVSEKELTDRLDQIVKAKQSQ